MKTGEQLPFPELLDITEAAEFLCTSIRHMRRLVAEDKLSVVKIGGKLRFDRADLQKFIDDHRRPGRAS
jgi:excisionase family DNA binding protein